ncbi:MAG TPA: UDP-N-acetylglucosamine--N-acetylmuramyl-(pentapeptide) pyrophosphoryl-undecaprenol N-acetylglucosamine transferase [Candidatus Cybelea sp.]|nr:UDP-N-acetylglucosamine--N-acetylmuramyl-(pentapeptide) pyrophosphoryl-undecaprenol N-acetylglucosamine transferase [Candidatus Cybelea sp.]
MTVVFAGGGTGGHLYPAIAIADALRGRSNRITFIGTSDRLETTIVPKAGYELRTITGRALQRAITPQLVRTIVDNLKGTIQSLRLLASARPQLVIATGGYVCFPVALAARIRRFLRLSNAPIVLLEPNAEPGLTNRLLAPIVDEVWGPALQPDRRFAHKYRPTGVPIRAALRDLPARDAAIARLGLDPSLRTLVAMGGSQGARAINDALVDLVTRDELPPGWQLLALTGAADYERVRAVLPHALPYLDDMAEAYAAADLVLARAGASTLAELAAIGKASILVPYPHAAQGHQDANAARFAGAGAAVLLNDRELQAGGLSALLTKTVDPPRLHALSQAAARLGTGDPVSAIVARVDALLSRRSKQ